VRLKIWEKTCITGLQIRYSDKIWTPALQQSSSTNESGWRSHSNRILHSLFIRNNDWVHLCEIISNECFRNTCVMSVILATLKAEIKRITVWSLPRQIVRKTLSQKTLSQKNWIGDVTQGEGPEFKPQYYITQKKYMCK
jgi:hypothetical protein